MPIYISYGDILGNIANEFAISFAQNAASLLESEAGAASHQSICEA